MHGGHQVAQKFSTIGWPCRAAHASGAPEGVSKVCCQKARVSAFSVMKAAGAEPEAADGAGALPRAEGERSRHANQPPAYAAPRPAATNKARRCAWPCWKTAGGAAGLGGVMRCPI